MTVTDGLTALRATQAVRAASEPQSPVKWAAAQQCENPLAKLVLLGLAHHTAVDYTFISLRKLAEWAGVSRNTVGNMLNELEDASLIARFRRTAADGGTIPSKIVLNIPR